MAKQVFSITFSNGEKAEIEIEEGESFGHRELWTLANSGGWLEDSNGVWFNPAQVVSIRKP